MATSLSHRRGTRKRRGNKLSSLMIFFVSLFAGIGLASTGFFIYFTSLAQTTTTTTNADGTQQQKHRSVIGVANLLRRRTGENNVVVGEKSINNNNEVYGEGKRPFPYYPKEGVISKNYDFTKFVPKGGKRYEEYKFGDVESPYMYVNGESDELANSRKYHVKKAMEHAWSGYVEHAFGYDELTPQSGRGNNRWGGLGITLIDSLDTLWLMDMKKEFKQATEWVQNNLSHDKYHQVSVFETTIRSLGGLLSAYDWSGENIYLEQAKDLGKRLFKAFDPSQTNGIPLGQVDLASGGGGRGRSTNIAEAATLQIEFRLLGRLSGIKEYKTKSEHVFELLHNMNPPNGLYPYSISTTGTPHFQGSQLTFGAMADSAYEYMLKIWLQGGKQETMYREMYDNAIQGMHDILLQKSTPSQLTFIADRNNGRLHTKMDHLVCFMGGLLALGAYTDPLGINSDRAQRDLQTGKALTYTCYQMYARMSTGISAEYILFQENNDFIVGPGAPHYLLRPETVESFFILYQLTKDPIYREWGWEVFQAIEKFCKTKYGYGALSDVNPYDINDVKPRDSMESFFLAETLKYLYLLFDPDTPVDILHKHVFNTEAHPVRIFPVMDEDGVQNLLS